MAKHALKKTAWVILGGITILVVSALIAASFLQDRLRRYTEQEVNRRATNYSIQIKGLELHPLRLVGELKEVVITEKRHPDQPVVAVQRATAGMRWRSSIGASAKYSRHYAAPASITTRW